METPARWELAPPAPGPRAAGTAGRPQSDYPAPAARHRDPGPAQPPPGKLSAQLPRFLAIGVASTLAYLALYWILRGFLPALAANALSLLVTAVANTAANRRLTFGLRGSDGAAKQQIQGLIAFGAGLILSSGALSLLHLISASPARMIELAVLVISNLAATAVRFTLYRIWVFNNPHPPHA